MTLDAGSLHLITTIPPTNAVLTTHTHGIWLLEIVVSFSFLDTKLLPRWKIILIHAIWTGYGLTVHGRGGTAGNGHPRIQPSCGCPNTDVCACSSCPGAGRRATSHSPHHLRSSSPYAMIIISPQHPHSINSNRDLQTSILSIFM